MPQDFCFNRLAIALDRQPHPVSEECPMPNQTNGSGVRGCGVNDDIVRPDVSNYRPIGESGIGVYGQFPTGDGMNTAAPYLARDAVGTADEFHHERVGGIVIDLLGAADLFDLSITQNCDSMPELERFGLVVGDE